MLPSMERMRAVPAAVCAVLPLLAACPLYVVVEAEEVDPCEGVVCGAHAECIDGSCECEPGHVPDDTAPEDCVAVQKILVEDGCDDGRDIDFRIWSSDGTWVWPGGTDVFRTIGYGLVTVAEIACPDGLTVCFGAASDGTQWGVGLDGDQPCDACCFDCFAGTMDMGVLVCDGGGLAPAPAGDDPNGVGAPHDSASPSLRSGPVPRARAAGLDIPPSGWHVGRGYEARPRAPLPSP